MFFYSAKEFCCPAHFFLVFLHVFFGPAWFYMFYYSAKEFCCPVHFFLAFLHMFFGPAWFRKNHAAPFYMFF
jgi:hypothetical protein